MAYIGNDKHFIRLKKNERNKEFESRDKRKHKNVGQYAKLRTISVTWSDVIFKEFILTDAHRMGEALWKNGMRKKDNIF